MKKFIFSKFSGLQAYSRQLYYQMNSFTGIFEQHFKFPPPPPMLPPCIDLCRHPYQILKSPPNWAQPPMFSTPVGNSGTCRLFVHIRLMWTFILTLLPPIVILDTWHFFYLDGICYLIRHFL